MAKPKVLWSLRLLADPQLLLVSQFVAPAQASAGVTASDDFNRADGGLGANWTAISDGGMAIASQQVTGTAGETTGDIRTAETYHQRSVLAGPGDLDAAVRGAVGRRRRCGCRAAGRMATSGIYYWNFGQPGAELFKRTGGGWTQLGAAYSSGVLAAGTQLELTAVGSTISLLAERRQAACRSPTASSPAARRASWPTGTAPPTTGPAAERGVPTRSAGRCRGCPGRWCCRITAGMT